jgi:hypothetical protein
LLFGDSSSNEFLGNTVFGFIPLDPNFTVNDVYVDQATVDAGFAILTKGHEQVTIGVFVKNSFTDQISVGIWDLGIGF